nr:MAG TPA: hypothetical protein [Caudoviricetes sp.]
MLIIFPIKKRPHFVIAISYVYIIAQVSLKIRTNMRGKAPQ